MLSLSLSLSQKLNISIGTLERFPECVVERLGPFTDSKPALVFGKKKRKNVRLMFMLRHFVTEKNSENEAE